MNNIRIMLILAFCQSTLLLGQFCPNDTNFDCVTGIKITQQEFDKMFKEVLIKESKNVERSTDDYINLFRIVNTIQWHQNLKSEYRKKIKTIKDKSILDGMLKLNAVSSKGGAMWSNKYKILIGGWRHYNSYYVIS